MAPKPSDDPPTYPHDEQYWLRGGDLYVLAGKKRLFRVHSSFLIRDSKYWNDQIPDPERSGNNQKAPGSHESVPLETNEAPEDFSWFLWVFYNPKYDVYEANRDQWFTIFRLATIWECPNICEFALSHIQKIMTGTATIEKIKIYQDHNVPRKYLLPLYIEIAIRERKLEREEFRVLDPDYAFCVVTAREMLHASQSGGSSQANQNEEKRKLDILKEAFSLSNKAVESLKASGILNKKIP